MADKSGSPMTEIPHSMLRFRADYDPTVMAAFQEGRMADDIWVAYCSDCKAWSYWNEGSHCNCRFCHADLDSDEAITMADYWVDSEYPCDMIPGGV